TTLTLSNVQAASAGNYSVSVSNAAGVVTSQSATLTVLPVGGPLAIADQTTPEDTPLLVPFAINAAETAPFLLAATSTNQSLVANTNLSFSGTGTNRTLLIVPNRDQSGTTMITVSVSNRFFSASDSFVLAVAVVNDPPTLNPINNWGAVRSTAQAVPISGITSGATNESQTLTVTASSSNTSLVNPTVSYTNGQTTGFIRFTPPNQSGSAVVTVTVNDGGTSNNITTQSFVAYVRQSSVALPTISTISDQTIGEDTSTAAIPFTISDPVTAATSLVLRASSSNPALVSSNAIVFGGSASNRTVTVTPASDAFGTTTITISVANTGSGLTNRSFLLTVLSSNDPPVLGTIADQTIPEDTWMFPLPFTVSDVDTHPSAVSVVASSSNTGLLPSSNIFISGVGANRYVRAMPATNQSGITTITLTANDGFAGTNSRAFTLTVLDQNDPPTISDIGNQVVQQNSTLANVPFTIADNETPANALTLSAASSNPTLVPIANITFDGSGTSRTLTLQPATNQVGTALITVTVRDTNGLTASDSFTLTVAGASSPPTLDSIPDLLLRQGSPPVSVPLTGITFGSRHPGAILAVSSLSSRPDIVPDPAVSYASPANSGALLLAPNPATNGTALITVRVNDGEQIVSRTFTVTIDGTPVISPIADQVIDEDSTTVPLGFTISDPETPATNLTLTVSSSNLSLVPLSNISITGTGSNRVATVASATDQFGSTFIGISVTDTNGGVATRNFMLVVNPVNDPPTLAPLSDISLGSGSSGGPYTVGLSNITSGASNENDDLLVTATTDNPSLFSSLAVEYASPSATGSLNFTPAAAAAGSTVVRVTVNDRHRINNLITRSFVVTFSPPPSPALQITRLDSLVTISFDTTTGASYTVEYKNSLSDFSWTPLGSARAGTGSTLTVTDDLSTAASRFYHVRVE
ncbi:MAG TPA: Ig-like domain-containing protein, partial [Candidatus Binatia bacterium]|nr:Ig-like domain-containing protein [Candidatus Binatia bacterium]